MNAKRTTWLVLAGIAAAACWVLLARIGGEPARPVEVGPGAGALLAPSGAGAQPEDVAAPGGAARGPSDLERPSPRGRTVTCLSARDRRPIAGIQLYTAEGPVGAPSAADGSLALDERATQRRTAWCEGWGPISIAAGSPVPAELLFEPADGAIEVRLTPFGPQDRVVRTLLQPHGRPATGDALWDPVLEPRGMGILVAERVPPDEYDVYVWVAAGGAGPRPAAARAVRVEPGSRQRVDLELRQGPEIEPDD